MHLHPYPSPTTVVKDKKEMKEIISTYVAQQLKKRLYGGGEVARGFALTLFRQTIFMKMSIPKKHFLKVSRNFEKFASEFYTILEKYVLGSMYGNV